MLPHAVTSVILASVSLPPQPVDVAWPTVEWSEGAGPAGLAELTSVVRHKDTELGETRAIVIVHHGKIVAEAYADGFGKDTAQVSWSVAKSVTQALLGIAVRRGLVDIDKPMGNPRWRADDPRALIPWRQWITMSDGQLFREAGVKDQLENDSALMLFGPGRLDIAAYGAALPLIHPPGTHWNYNSAGINLIADGLGHLFSPNADAKQRRSQVAAVLKDELFSPIGMMSATPEFDAAGTFFGSALVYATARDWARFGTLYLRDGVWDGRRILPDGWVDFARQKTPAPDCDIYGAGFWVMPETGPGKPYAMLVPDGPRDLFYAEGFLGQFVLIVPSKDLVIVRLGRTTNRPAMKAWIARAVSSF